MPTQLSSVLATARPVMIGKEEYHFSPLTIMDYAELNEWIRARPVVAQTQAICEMEEKGMIVSLDLCQKLMTVSQNIGMAFTLAAISIAQLGERSTEMDATVQGMRAVMSSPDFIIQLWTKSLWKKHKLLKSAVASLIEECDQVPYITDMIWKLSNGSELEDKEEADPKVNGTRKGE